VDNYELFKFNRLNKGFQILQSISLEISNSENIEHTLNKIIDLIVDFMRVRKASIMLLEPDGYLRISAYHGMSENLAKSTSVKLGSEISGKVAQTGKLIMSQDVRHDPSFQRPPRIRYETDSFICVPIKVKHVTIGVINVNDKIGNSSFDLYDIELLSIVACQTGTVLKQFQLYNDLKTSHNQLNQINQTLSATKTFLQSIIEYIKDGIVVTDPNGLILLYNKKTSEFFPEITLKRSVFKTLTTLEFGEWLMKQFHEVSKKGFVINDYSLTNVLHNKSYRVYTRPVHSSASNCVYYLNIFSDISLEIESEKTRSAFLSSISHKLRTPLTVIKAYLDPMFTGQLGAVTDELRDAFSTISEAAIRLQHEIDNLLLISRLEKDIKNPDMEQISIETLIKKQLAILYRESAISVSDVATDFNNSRTLVTGNRKLLGLAIRNLLIRILNSASGSKTIKVMTLKCDCFNSPGVNVRISYATNDSDMQIDSGTSVNSTNSSVSHFDDLNTELYISKRILEIHNSFIKYFQDSQCERTLSFKLAAAKGVRREN
jgi:signal transduction histidine kinase/putative methionine-R-sulfoxide reductase with GAF domain